MLDLTLVVCYYHNRGRKSSFFFV